MRFSKSMLLVGEGRLTGAVERDGGAIEFFIDTDGAIVKRRMRRGSRAVSKGEIVSYADDYTETASLSISLLGNELEVKTIGS
ncbi:MAG: hypothetical protein FWH03_01200 [Firmicutes bacterium]|nr:hypothetical protein [Bacillota bacterium]